VFGYEIYNGRDIANIVQHKFQYQSVDLILIQPFHRNRWSTLCRLVQAETAE
jgi:hypothetical protein